MALEYSTTRKGSKTELSDSFRVVKCVIFSSPHDLNLKSQRKTTLATFQPNSRFIAHNAPCCGRVWTHAGLRGEREEQRPQIQLAQIQHALCACVYAPRFQGTHIM
jgi:hypothetical protein